MKKTKLLLFLSLICSLSITLNLTADGSVFDFTDELNDVMKINWNSDGNGGSYTFVDDQEDYDIKGSLYSLNDENEVELSLIVKGNIDIINNAYYQIIIFDETNGFSLETWYGIGWSSATKTDISGYSYYNSSRSGIKTGDGSAKVKVFENVLTLTLSKMVTFGANDIQNITYPTKTEPTWDWHVSSWRGDNLVEKSGIWYYDYGPDTDNKYTDVLDPSNTSGFEFITIFVVAVLIKTRRIVK